MQIINNGDGSHRIKNGSGTWGKPVVYGGVVFGSGVKLANELKINPSKVSDSIRDGRNLGAGSVSFASRKEIEDKFGVAVNSDADLDERSKTGELTVRMTKDGNIEAMSAAGKWQKAVMYKGKFYRNAAAVVAVGHMSSSQIYKALADDGNDNLRYAIYLKDAPVGAVVVHAMPESGKKKANKKAKSKAARVAATASPGPVREVASFTGVEWPDGSVTVKFVTGKSKNFELSWPSKDKLPAELVEACSWLR